MNDINFDDKQIVFEQFKNYQYYLLGNSEIKHIDDMIYFEDDQSIVIPASELNESLSIIDKLNKNKDIYVKYVSKNQADRYHGPLVGLGFSKSTRSQNEVIYDVGKLVNLKGSDYSKLRNKSRIISKVGFDFKPLDESNKADVLYVNDIWRKQRGSIYKRDRSLCEKSIINFVCNHPNDNDTKGIVQYLNNKPTGFCIYDVSRPVFIQFITKGLNDSNEGNKLASTALYLKVFEIASALGFKFINDGDLGYEAGTVNHKKSFRPIRYYKTYDYMLLRSTYER